MILRLVLFKLRKGRRSLTTPEYSAGTACPLGIRIYIARRLSEIFIVSNVAIRMLQLSIALKNIWETSKRAM